ncbi:MAG: hypothetical protein WC054_13410 [Candidatus Nanopelagicales bacterium]
MEYRLRAGTLTTKRRLVLASALIILGLVGMHALTASIGSCHATASVVHAAAAQPGATSHQHVPAAEVSDSSHIGLRSATQPSHGPAIGETGDGGHIGGGICMAIIVGLFLLATTTVFRRNWLRRRLAPTVHRNRTWRIRPPPELVIVRVSVLRL